MATVRPATVTDLESIVAMGAALHQESPRYRGMIFDPEKLWTLLRNLIGTPTAAVFVAQTDEGETAGMAAVLAVERWFGPDRYCTDLAVYVKPEHRGNGSFVLLVQAIEAWAREQRVRDLDIGISTDIDAERSVRAYARLGYTLAATRVMTKRLDDHVHRS